MIESDLKRNPDGTLKLKLKGSFDENADIEALFTEIDGDVAINLRGVKRLNSIGVHQWVTAITKLTKQYTVCIEQCSYPVALQASYVANFFGGAKVASTLAPYFCASCSYNGMMVVQSNEITAEEPPTKKCPSCSADMQFDELDTYLNFLSPVN